MRSFVFYCFLVTTCSLPAQLPYAEDFSGGTLPAGWSTADLSTNADPLLWSVCNAPTTCAPFTSSFTANTLFASPTAANGYVVADSDAYGEQEAAFISTLNMPPLDCTSHDSVYLSFFSFIATAQLPAAENAVVEVRSDGGPWTTYTPFCALQYEDENTRSPNPQRVVLDISLVAAQQAQVDIRWRWTGIWEDSWAIDDVRVTATDPRYAQTMWGARPGEGDFVGGLNDWTVNTLTAPGPDLGWRWLPEGYYGDAFFAVDTRHLTSPTVCNGAMVFNADFYSTGGDTPIDPPYPVYISELISPVIDLSDQTLPLTLEWYESLRLFQAAGGYVAPTLLATSSDGGQTWSAPVDLHPELGQNDTREGPRSYALPAALSGNGNVRFKFIFAAEFFWWAIDDVRLTRRAAYDLGLDEQYVALSPSAVVPASQVDPLYFFTDLLNGGSQAATNARVYASVRQLPDVEPLFQDSLLLGTVPADTLLTNLLFENAYTPPAAPGLYEIAYRTSADTLDQLPADNSVVSRFQISDTTFAKERGRTRAIAPSGGAAQYAYGNCFYLPRGNGWYGSSISFGLANPAALSGDELLVSLHEWDGDLNNNGLADADTEYRTIGINAYTITGGEEQLLITVPLLPSEGDEIALRDDKYYLATVTYGGNGTCFFQASEAYNYTATFVLSDSLQQSRYASVLRTDFTTNAYDLVGFGLDVVPVVRLHIRDTPTSTADVSLPAIRYYPNPVQDYLYLSGEEIVDGYFAQLIDAAGRIRQTKRLRNGTVFHVAALPQGHYQLRIYDPQTRAGRFYSFVKN